MAATMPQQVFLDKISKLHPTLDFSKFRYKGSKEYGTVICPKHGEFKSTPNRMTSQKCGCPRCSGRGFRHTQETFIERSKEVHGDLYSYDKVEFINQNTKVFIYCPDHNDYFEQTPKNHMAGRGCNQCKDAKRRITFDKFVVLAKEKFGDRFLYSKDKYDLYLTPTEITCKVHNNTFKTTPNRHLITDNGGCTECASRFSNTREFISKAKEVHGDYYDYSKVDYVDSYTHVSIICKIHKEFSQVPNTHLMGSGCSACSGRKLTKLDFVKKAEAKHGRRYDYSIVNYVNMNEKVDIICNNCKNVFSQTAANHVGGRGCPKCSATYRGGETYVYVLKTVEGKYKLGVSFNVKERIKVLGVSKYEEIYAKLFETKNLAKQMESQLHQTYQHLRTYPGPKIFDGSTEIFNLNEDQVREVIQFLESL